MIDIELFDDNKKAFDCWLLVGGQRRVSSGIVVGALDMSAARAVFKMAKIKTNRRLIEDVMIADAAWMKEYLKIYQANKK